MKFDTYKHCGVGLLFGGLTFMLQQIHINVFFLVTVADTV